MMTTQARILVVDDVLANQLVLKRMLEAQGHLVTSVGDGDTALRLLHDQAFDMVLLDIMMPMTDGYEVLAALRERANWHHLPVVVVSAIDDTASVARCLALGAADYLYKPINQTLLKARVEACLVRKWAHDKEHAAARALEAADRTRSELLALISHELANPVTAIKGYADLLLRRGADALDGSTADGLRAIGRLAQLMSELLHDLNDLTRIEAGALRLHLDAVPLDAVATTAVQAVQSHLIAKEQELSLALPEGLPPLRADGMRVAQILTNLLSNASKYTPRRGSIALRARCLAGAEVELAVSDTGIGIAAEDQGRIFERFFRSPNPAVRAERGTGMGLYISRLLAEAQGGRIWFTSRPGAGTTFYLALPLCDDAGPVLTTDAPAARPHTAR